MHHGRLIGLVVVVGCSSKSSAPPSGSAGSAAPPPTPAATIDAPAPPPDSALAIDASLAPDAAVGAAAPDFQPACASGVPIAALARLGLERRCAAAPTTQFAAATLRGKRVVVVGLDGTPTVFVGGQAIDDSSTDAHSGGEWWLLEQLERQLGGRRALAKLGDADAVALLGMMRAVRVQTYPGERVARVALTEAAVATLAAEWPPIKAAGDVRARTIDPTSVYLHTTDAGRTLGGWYETNHPTTAGDCVKLHELRASLNADGKLDLGDSDYLERGDGCPTYPPDKPNVFPD